MAIDGFDDQGKCCTAPLKESSLLPDDSEANMEQRSKDSVMIIATV